VGGAALEFAGVDVNNIPVPFLGFCRLFLRHLA
jgi:hypothetical protein